MTLTGSESLEDVVQDYINRNLDYFEIASIVSVRISFSSIPVEQNSHYLSSLSQEVIDSLHRNPRISLPLGTTYSLVNTYIREACRVAWHMQCLVYPLDIAFASDAEVFDDTKYVRKMFAKRKGSFISLQISS